ASLGAEGYEDLRRQYDDLDQLHQRLIAQARVLLRVKSAFVIAEQEVKHQAEKPLMESFARQVAELTGGRYGVVGETGFLEFSLQHQDEYSMPLNLLSAGTLDSVALAFRFALLDKLFPDGGGMVVLDDCLVDLDPERRARAATMIKKWARNNQVIYVTCDPATAELLGGQIVRLG
ncbi:MAG: ATP-binding protein, partial [Methylocystaceae bacterium]